MNKWRAQPRMIYLPFEKDLKAIAKIADCHPQPEKFLLSVMAMVQELARVDGVEV